jgi:DNA-binding response OmpR family regulator
MITEWRPPFHPPYSHRILYAGNDLMLCQFLKYTLEECQTVRCPAGSVSRLFIDKIDYSLLLFDEYLPDTTGLALTRYARSLAHRRHTPIVIFRKSDDFERLARDIKRLLAARKSRGYFAGGNL